jgi:threonine dehydratase
MRLRETPLVAAEALGGVLLKLENLQVTGSFKARGAARAIENLSREQCERGVVAASAGNHGAGLAWAARERGAKVTVLVPERTPQNKIERMRGFGAEVRVKGEDYDASEVLARRLAAESGRTFISPFEHPDVIAGNGGDLARELLRQCPRLGGIVVPVGGGGLLAGLAQVLVPRGVTVVGVEPAENCAMRESLAEGRALTSYSAGRTIAEGCEGAVGEMTYSIVAEHGVDVLTVSEAGIAAAVALLYRRCGVVAEASAAVAVAALRERAPDLRGLSPLAVVITGGNIDDSDLESYLAGA